MDDICDLRSNPEFVLELLAIAVGRLGGEALFSAYQTLPPFDLRATIYEDEGGSKSIGLKLIIEGEGTMQ